MSRRKIRTLYEKEMEEQKMREMQLHGDKKYEGEVRRGDIFFFDKSNVTGVEQQGGRPGVVVSNNACNSSSDFVLVCYLTTQEKTKLPTHVPVKCEQNSICLCEQIHCLSKEKMQRYCCTATTEEMDKIDKALMLTLGLDDFDNYTNQHNDSDLNEIAKLKEREKALLDDLNGVNNLLDINEKQLEKTELDLREQLRINSLLVNELEEMKKESERNPEYIKASTERDVYKELYKELYTIMFNLK